MSKTLKYQHFKTLDMVILVVLLSFTGSIVATMLSESFDDPDNRLAIQGAQSLALQLASGGLGKLKSEKLANDREPAEIKKKLDYRTSMKLFGQQGRIGNDPWGSAYRYEFVQDVEAKEMFVVVRSDGANKKSETPIGKTKVFKQLGKAFVVLQGDDLAYVHKISVHD